MVQIGLSFQQKTAGQRFSQGLPESAPKQLSDPLSDALRKGHHWKRGGFLVITTSMVSHDEYLYVYKQCIIDSYNICNYKDIIRYIYTYYML